MNFYGVLPADSGYRGDKPLTYSFDGELADLSAVTVPLRQKMVTGFVASKVKKPAFSVKPIKNVLSPEPLPSHCLELAKWLADYYATSMGEALRQFAPSRPMLRKKVQEPLSSLAHPQLSLASPLTADQKKALKTIRTSTNTTLLLHGETGTGKTRVYVELAKEVLESGRSVILLTPEIALTSQLAAAAEKLPGQIFIIHSHLSAAQRKSIWLQILEVKEPVVVIGPRSALFTPVRNPGLIVLDEAHEPSYKQDQSPRYQTTRVASQLGKFANAKVILGTATPTVADYYVGSSYNAIVRMTTQAAGGKPGDVKSLIVDLGERQNFSSSPYLSNQLIEAINTTIAAKKQIIVYLNRRGSARLILCSMCGWQAVCPNCDVPLVYHGDEHLARCHICGFKTAPPGSCPQCQNPDIIYKSIGTKALTQELIRLFPSCSVRRFDSDNIAGERINEVFGQLQSGQVDILVGTQLLAKGLDLPRLGLVGVVAAESSAGLPDYTAEERTFQLLYQVIGRVGRGHSKGKVIVQSYNPANAVIKAAIERDFESFYKYTLLERQKYRFPPFSYLMQLTCRRASSKSAETAARKVKQQLQAKKLPVEIIGPAPSFYARRGRYYYYQLVVKSKDRHHLLELAKAAPADCTVNLDPVDLL